MLCFFSKRSYAITGEQGGISFCVTLPDGFNPESDKCPMAILMHGFMASKDRAPINKIASELAKAGIASIRFDFNAHGKSEGEFRKMTMANEISDAKAVYDYVCSLPYVTDIAFVGHSQGGVIAGMLAGQLEESGASRLPVCMVQLAAAAVLKDDALKGQCMNARYDPENPPEYVNVFFHKLGREFIKAAQVLPIYETSSKYTGKVCLIHGTADKIVPVSYSERYDKEYANSELHIVEGLGHFMNDKAVYAMVVDFLRRNL